MIQQFFSKKFQASQHNDCHFILKVDETVWHWGIINVLTHELMGISGGNYSQIHEIQKMIEPLNLPSFRNRSLILISSHHLLIPKSLYQEQHLDKFFRFFIDKNNDEDVLSNDMFLLDAVNVFSFEHDLNDFALHNFGHESVVHISTALLKSSYHISKQHFSPVLLIGIYQKTAVFILSDGGKVLLSNHFKVLTNEDLLYWAIRLFDQFELDAAKSLIYLVGDKMQTVEQLFFLKRYFEHAALLPWPSFITPASDIPDSLLSSLTEALYFLK
ncbi:MAG: DUF3822 family protein [Microbacter sp.]